MKKSKKNIADAVSSATSSKKLNPFEVHINRQKYDVLGKKSKTEKGLPGVSRSKAIRKRKATLLQEYKLKGKVNMFVDRRIGERDASMTSDDKILARYTTERMKFHSRKSLYNLGDSDVLTHRGESLADIEKFEDPKSDEDDDDDQDDGRNRSGKLDQDFVSEAHFGGGMLKKVDGENKSRKDLIDQMIADSKKRKAEKQKLREQTLDMTEKLDTAWKDILPLVASSKKSRIEDAVAVKSDQRFASYDKLSKELMFEARGKATDKLKSEEEIAKENKKKLEELEKQRLKRMAGDVSEAKGVKHRSADDLDDGFDFNDEGDLPASKKKSKKPVADGEGVNFEGVLIVPESTAEDKGEETEDEVKSEIEDIDVEEAVADEKAGDSSDLEDDDESDDDDDDSDSDSDLSDLKSSDEESDSVEGVPVKKTLKRAMSKLAEANEEVKTSAYEAEKDESSPADNNGPKLEDSLKDLAFTLGVPDTYGEFDALCAGRQPEYQAVVVERMVKSNHPSLPDGSREKLVTLLTYCLQHLQDTALDPDTAQSSFRVLDRFAPWLFDLTQFAPATASSMLCDVIKEKYTDFLKRPHRFPGLDTLVFLKLVGILFPTSDFRHRLVTPTLVFMQHILASCRVQSSKDVAVGLLVTTLVLEYTMLSKRFTPEAINFLRGILRSAQAPECTLPTIPPFKTKLEFSLYVAPSSSYRKLLTPLGSKDLTSESNSPEFKLRAVNLALQLLDGFCDNFDKSSEILILEPFIPLLQGESYCKCLKDRLVPVSNKVASLQKKKLYKLVTEKKKPKPLKLYEPKIEDVSTFKKKRPMTKEKEEHDKLVYKYKKEVKGALREIRRDNTFLAKLKFNETKSSDLERQRKVKEIFGDAAQQFGDIKKMKRESK